eukprot:1158994-Pelagomonas_calceolata.AAC.12
MFETNSSIHELTPSHPPVCMPPWPPSSKAPSHASLGTLVMRTGSACGSRPVRWDTPRCATQGKGIGCVTQGKGRVYNTKQRFATQGDSRAGDMFPARRERTQARTHGKSQASDACVKAARHQLVHQKVVQDVYLGAYSGTHTAEPGQMARVGFRGSSVEQRRLKREPFGNCFGPL